MSEEWQVESEGENEMNIIIPMTGYGSRFAAAGYRELKPLIHVQGKTIIEWIVTGMYSKEDHFYFVCRKEHLKKIKGMRELLENIAENVTVLAVEPWKKLGPVNDILCVGQFIPDDAPCIVNYCDVFLEWDWQSLKRHLEEEKCDGAVICWTGFNPSCLPEKNVFASCLVDEDHYLSEIKEKHYFSNQRMDGHYSAGVYYYSSGSLMKQYFKREVEDENMVNGEYYASVAYMYMVKDGLRIWAPDDCVTFCNFGTPQDLEDYLFWIHTVEKMNEKINILIPMAGAGERFVKAGYKQHKPLLPVFDRHTGERKPMVVCAVSDIPGIDKCNKLIFVDRTFDKAGGVEQELITYFPNAGFITIDYLTEGQACTCLLAKKEINNEEQLLISACDNGLEYDRTKFERLKQTCDCIVFTHKSDRTVENPNAYGWVRVDGENNVLEISCKRAISDTPEKDNAIVATFWFKKGSIFVESAERMIRRNDRVNNEFYVDEVIQHVIELGYHAKVFVVDKYIGWGTPKDYEAYHDTLSYWNRFYHSSSYRRVQEVRE